MKNKDVTILLCILWFTLLFTWFITKSVTIALLFFVIWISLRYMLHKNLT